jgi:hypothetical protein
VEVEVDGDRLRREDLERFSFDDLTGDDDLFLLLLLLVDG